MATTNPIDALEAGAKQWLAEMDDDQFAALVEEVRPPASERKSTTPDSNSNNQELRDLVRKLTANK